ncbi:MAG TPA: hypothetical protein VGD64_01815 [Acidisarcina sp.]
MGRSKRVEKRELQLAAAKEEFEALLLACLPECARGRWGLFDQRDSIHTAEHALPADRHAKKMARANASLHLLEADPEETEVSHWDGDANAPKSHERGWPEADRLRELAAELVSLRAAMSDDGPWLPLDAYLRACSVKGANVTGEPRLAMTALEELRAGGAVPVKS